MTTNALFRAWLRLGVLFLAIGSAAPVQAQTYFNNRYAAAPFYSAATAILANGKGVILASTAGRVVGRYTADLALTFLDSAGVVQQTRFYQHHAGDDLKPGVSGSLLRLPDGGMALVGDVSGPMVQGLLWRFNAQGDTLWTHTYAGQYWLVTRSGCLLPDGGFLLVGSDQVIATGGTDALVIRTDSLGNELWRRRFNVNQFEDMQWALPTPDGGYLVTGYTELYAGSGPTDNDWLVIKLDSVGTVQWQRTLGRPAFNEGAGEALRTADGGYLICGSLGDRVLNSSWSAERPALVKFDSAGRVQWQRKYGPGSIGGGASVLRALPDGGYLLGGGISDPAATQPRAGPGIVFKVCADGDSVWYRMYQNLLGPQSQNYFRDLVLTADGGIASCGFVFPYAPDTGTDDVWAFKADANGYLLPGGAPPTVTCRPVGLAEPAATEAVEVWPNPAPDGRFTVGGLGAGATLTVSDALGRLVWRGTARGAETVVELGRQPAGLYLLRIIGADGRLITKKLLR